MNRGLVAVLAATLGVAAIGAGAAAKDGEKSWREDEMKRRFVEKVGLTEAQADKLEAAMKERRKAVRPLKRELRDAMLKLKDQVEDEAGDEQVKATLERLKKARNAMRAEKDRFQTKIAEMLPPTVSAKLLLARGKMRAHMRGMGPGGPGGMRRFEKRMLKRRHHRGGPGDGPGDDDEERLKDAVHEEETVEREEVEDD